MPTVLTNDGRTLNFPEGMSKDAMEAALRQLPPPGPSIADTARQHLAGIAAGTDVPPGGMQPAASETVHTSAGDVTPGGAEPGFGQRLKEGTIGAVKGAGEFIGDIGSGDPLRMVHAVTHNVISPALHEADKAQEAFSRPGIGPKVEAIGHAAAAALPGIGPAAAAPAEDFAAGNLSGAAGGATALAVPFAASAAAPRIGAAVRSAGEGLTEASVRAVAKLLDPEGKFPAQAEALAQSLNERGIKITDPKAQAGAAGAEVAQAAEDAGVKVKSNKMADMADALPETEPLNAGKRLLSAGRKAAIGGAAAKLGEMAGGHGGALAAEALAERFGGGIGQAGVEMSALARDVIAGKTFGKWKANTQAAFGRALMDGDVGSAVSTAAKADMALHGTDDEAYGAVSHLSQGDLMAIYNGGQAVYVDPSGKTIPLRFGPKESQANAGSMKPLPEEAEWMVNGHHENEALVAGTPFSQLLPGHFAKARAAMGSSPTSGGVMGEHDTQGVYGVAIPEGKNPFVKGKIEFPGGVTRSEPISDVDRMGKWNREHPGSSEPPNVIQTAKGVRGDFVPLHEYGHAAWEDLSDAQRAKWDALFKGKLAAAGSDRSKLTRAMDRPDFEGWHAFPSIFAAYVLDPSRLRAKDRDAYQLMKDFFRGREYIGEGK